MGDSEQDDSPVKTEEIEPTQQSEKTLRGLIKSKKEELEQSEVTLRNLIKNDGKSPSKTTKKKSTHGSKILSSID